MFALDIIMILLQLKLILNFFIQTSSESHYTFKRLCEYKKKYKARAGFSYA